MAREAYEERLRALAADYDHEVRLAQQRGEENARASEALCNELKRQLQQALDFAEQLQQKLISTENELAEAREQTKRFEEQRNQLETVPLVPTNLEAFLSAMTCLSVSVEQTTSKGVIYLCRMDDGQLRGHSFTLALNTSTWEYTYNPLEPSNNLLPESFLMSRLCFPDSMLSRFLLNLLKATYNS